MEVRVEGRREWIRESVEQGENISMERKVECLNELAEVVVFEYDKWNEEN